MKKQSQKLQLGLEGSSVSDLRLPVANPTASSISFRDGISALNELSTGLSVGIINSDFLTSYQGVVKTQIKALSDSLALGENFRLGTTKIDSFIEGSIAPMSSVIAGMGLATINARKLYEIGTLDESAFASVQKISGLCLDIIQGQQSILSSTINGIQDSGMFQLASGSLISTQVISSGVNNVLRSLPTYPTEIKLPTLERAYKRSEVTEGELSEHQEKLDKLLLKVDPLLVEYRKGCWETFRKKGRDYIGQSSSSMRRLVDELLRIMAPMEKVIETDFFKNSPGAKDPKGKPTRKARVYHIVMFDDKKVEHIERLTRGFLEAYDNLSAWDHKPLKQDAFVHGVFVTIEGYLISLLSEAQQQLD